MVLVGRSVERSRLDLLRMPDAILPLIHVGPPETVAQVASWEMRCSVKGSRCEPFVPVQLGQVRFLLPRDHTKGDLDLARKAILLTIHICWERPLNPCPPARAPNIMSLGDALSTGFQALHQSAEICVERFPFPQARTEPRLWLPRMKHLLFIVDF